MRENISMLPLETAVMIYVNPKKATVVAVTGTFKSAVHDRIDLIQKHIEPLLDESV